MFNGYHIQTVLVGLCACVCLSLVMIFPQDAFDAATEGISIWWNILFPALFPFFVVAELMIGFGIVHGIGCILDPMMRPLFRVPGVGGFVMAIGFASGYPVGARMTIQLWKQQLLTKSEAERLIAFSTTADPIFLASAVCLVFFQDIRLAGIFVFSHYVGAFIVGIVMRYYRYTDVSLTRPTHTSASYARRVFDAVHHARLTDGRSPSLVLAQAIQQALKLIMIIGGLVVFFSVILRLWQAGKLLSGGEWFLQSLLTCLNISPDFSQALLYGFFEVTLGTKTAAQQTSTTSLMAKSAVASFIVAWAGLCVHAQIMSMTSSLQMNVLTFMMARVLHGCLSAGIMVFSWGVFFPTNFNPTAEAPVFLTVIPAEVFETSPYVWTIALCGMCITIVVGAYAIYSFCTKIHALLRFKKS